jgi:Carboxypeptidase regulatory-like domain/Carbohydrate-selective porin, OprB family
MNRVCLATACAVFLTASGAFAQTSTVNGRVANARGGVVAEAEVTLHQLPPPGQPAMRAMPNMPGMTPDRTAVAGADGTFTFPAVPAGQYVIMADALGFERASQELVVGNQTPRVTLTLAELEVPGAEPVAGAATTAATDPQALLNRIKTLEQRIADLESGTVLSEPETRVKRIEVFKDKNGIEYDEPVPGAAKTVTYQRERVYRRQWLSEKLEQAFADQEAKKIAVGVSAASVTQFARQTSGPSETAAGHAYQLASADLFFSAGLAQYTSFFADIVGLSGAPPDAEIPGLTLLNSYTARLVRQNEVNVREAWLRTELFSQKLAISAGRLDLTNYFDRNAGANDETSQFISDALVNNPMLGLAANGAGVVGVFDAKNGFAFKAGLQQSNTDATNLSESLYTLAEVDYLTHIPGLSVGNYRLWFRNDNSTTRNRNGVGISADQKLTNVFGLFGRWGSAESDVSPRDNFWSAGLQIQNGLVFNPLDYWGVGFGQTQTSQTDPTATQGRFTERMIEGYYNFELSEKLRLSLHLQHQFERVPGAPETGFLIPAIRVQARF